MTAELAALMRAAAADADGQAEMWPAGDDLPLWSGVPVRVAAPVAPLATGGASRVRLPLGGCGLCLGTGVVVVKGKRRRCWCGAAQGGTR
jgi:hypothetical protein